MDEIVPGLFISDLRAAEDEKLLRLNRIENILSLGCRPKTYSEVNGCEVHVRQHLVYEALLDVPESALFDILAVTSDFINQALCIDGRTVASSLTLADVSTCDAAAIDASAVHPSADSEYTSRRLDTARIGNVLVHCVYGQSRSAAIILHYLITHRRTEYPSLSHALRGLRERHQDACINPGFLAQLYLIDRALSDATDRPALCLIHQQQHQHKQVFTGMKRPASSAGFDMNEHAQWRIQCKEHEWSSSTLIRCAACKIVLADGNHVINNQCDLLQKAQSFVSKYVDDYWRQYAPNFKFHAKVAGETAGCSTSVKTTSNDALGVARPQQQSKKKAKKNNVVTVIELPIADCTVITPPLWARLQLQLPAEAASVEILLRNSNSKQPDYTHTNTSILAGVRVSISEDATGDSGGQEAAADLLSDSVRISYETSSLPRDTRTDSAAAVAVEVASTAAATKTARASDGVLIDRSDPAAVNLHCPGCGAVVGCRAAEKLNLISLFLLSDLYVLFDSHIETDQQN